MKYEVNGVVMDVSCVIEHLRKGHILPACKIIQANTGCSLAAARGLYFEMLHGEDIQEPPEVVEMRAYLQAEYGSDE